MAGSPRIVHDRGDSAFEATSPMHESGPKRGLGPTEYERRVWPEHDYYTGTLISPFYAPRFRRVFVLVSSEDRPTGGQIHPIIGSFTENKLPCCV